MKWFQGKGIIKNIEGRRVAFLQGAIHIRSLFLGYLFVAWPFFSLSLVCGPSFSTRKKAGRVLHVLLSNMNIAIPLKRNFEDPTTPSPSTIIGKAGILKSCPRIPNT
jgi:hypothetical protein